MRVIRVQIGSSFIACTEQEFVHMNSEHQHALCVNTTNNILAPYRTYGRLFATDVCAKFKVA